jgi:hypothetical protein
MTIDDRQIRTRAAAADQFQGLGAAARDRYVSNARIFRQGAADEGDIALVVFHEQEFQPRSPPDARERPSKPLLIARGTDLLNKDIGPRQCQSHEGAARGMLFGLRLSILI